MPRRISLRIVKTPRFMCYNESKARRFYIKKCRSIGQTEWTTASKMLGRISHKRTVKTSQFTCWWWERIPTFRSGESKRTAKCHSPMPRRHKNAASLSPWILAPFGGPHQFRQKVTRCTRLKETKHKRSKVKSSARFHL